MKNIKATCTVHGLKRIKERAGVKNVKEAEHIVEVVMKRGYTYEDCCYKIDYDFLRSRTRNQMVAYAYNGYCYIINKNKKVVITMYPLPKSFGKKKGNYFKKNNKKYNRLEYKAESIRIYCSVDEDIMDW